MLFEYEHLKNAPCTFVLGAGFSVDYNPRYVPLSKNFMAIAEQNGFLDPRGRHKELVDFIRKYYGEYTDVNIESLATFLTSPLIPAREYRYDYHAKLYSDLTEIIFNTVEDVHRHPASDDIRRRYQQFANFLVDVHANIITFNYDLILDDLLGNTRYWYPPDGYGTEMRVFPESARMNSVFQAGVLKPINSEVKLFKLHGSVNWGKPLLPQQYGPEGVFLNEGSALRPMVSLSRYEHVSHPELEPFIVPPILSKDQIQREPILMNSWHRAREALKKSRMIFVIGYSFPQTDFFFEFLIRQATSAGWEAYSDMRDAFRQVRIVLDTIPIEYRERVQRIFKNSDLKYDERKTADFIRDYPAEIRKESRSS